MEPNKEMLLRLEAIQRLLEITIKGNTYRTSSPVIGLYNEYRDWWKKETEGRANSEDGNVR